MGCFLISFCLGNTTLPAGYCFICHMDFLCQICLSHTKFFSTCCNVVPQYFCIHIRFTSLLLLIFPKLNPLYFSIPIFVFSKVTFLCKNGNRRYVYLPKTLTFFIVLLLQPRKTFNTFFSQPQIETHLQSQNSSYPRKILTSIRAEA